MEYLRMYLLCYFKNKKTFKKLSLLGNHRVTFDYLFFNYFSEFFKKTFQKLKDRFIFIMP